MTDLMGVGRGGKKKVNPPAVKPAQVQNLLDEQLKEKRKLEAQRKRAEEEEQRRSLEESAALARAREEEERKAQEAVRQRLRENLSEQLHIKSELEKQQKEQEKKSVASNSLPISDDAAVQKQKQGQKKLVQNLTLQMHERKMIAQQLKEENERAAAQARAEMEAYAKEQQATQAQKRQKRAEEASIRRADLLQSEQRKKEERKRRQMEEAQSQQQLSAVLDKMDKQREAELKSSTKGVSSKVLAHQHEIQADPALQLAEQHQQLIKQKQKKELVNVLSAQIQEKKRLEQARQTADKQYAAAIASQTEAAAQEYIHQAQLEQQKRDQYKQELDKQMATKPLSRRHSSDDVRIGTGMPARTSIVNSNIFAPPSSGSADPITASKGKARIRTNTVATRPW